MSGSPTSDTEKKQNRKIERGEFITPPRPTGRRSNNYMWLLETKYKDNNVRTINSDVFQTMKLPSMKIFKRNQYQTLYKEIQVM